MKHIEGIMVRLLGLSRRPPSGATYDALPEARDTMEERREVARKLVETRRRLAGLQVESDMDRGQRVGGYD